MKMINSLFVLLLSLFITTNNSHANVLDFLFGAGSFGRKTGTVGDCRNLVTRYKQNTRFWKDETWKNRVVTDRNPDFLNDTQYLDEIKYNSQTLAIVDRKYVKKFDTDIYYTATAKPLSDGTIPMVDPEAKGLIVYFHGSGTKKASGVGFAGKCTALAKLGYSCLSFDLPFHANGTRNPMMAKTEEFSKYVNDIINEYRVKGQPVTLMGHSFGPDPIAEFVTRYPYAVDNAVLISPGGFDKVTKKWYEEKTSRMDFGETEMNEEGGRWAGLVTANNTWNKPGAAGRVDPTIANPNLKISVVTGSREEYIPGPLDPITGKPSAEPRTYDVKEAFQKIFHRVDVHIEPGVGHYIFAHLDESGHDVVVNAALKANGESLANAKAMQRAVAERFATRPAYDLLAVRYQKEPFFKTYVDMVAKKQGKDSLEMIVEFSTKDDKKGAQNILTNYLTIEKQRLDAIHKNIIATKEWAQDFYAKHQEAIDALASKAGDKTTIRERYLEFLKTVSPEKLRTHSVATPEVYVVAEKTQLTPEEIALRKEAAQKQKEANKGKQQQRQPSQQAPEASP